MYFSSLLLIDFSLKYFSVGCLPLKTGVFLCILCSSLPDTSIRYALTRVSIVLNFNTFSFAVQASFNSCSSASSNVLSK